MHLRFLIAFILLFITFRAGEAQKFDLQVGSNPSNDNLYESYIEKYAPSEDAFIAVQRMAERFITKKEWEQASEIYKKFKPKFPAMADRFDKIIALLLKENEGLNYKKLDKNVNTNAGEYHPTPTGDGKKTVFHQN